MSSLAAARADNFYYPPEYDPAKHGSLNQFQGQHPLRDRARKLDEGILVIRFEVPFNIWCDTCGEHIAKGVRFNAEKKQVGSYFSTKIWSFTMRHHCGCKITITTDPKNAEYIVSEGARRKIETYDAEDAQTIQLPDPNERAAISSDPLASLERTTLQARKAAEGRVQLVALAAEREAKGRDPYSLNKQLRAAMRASKKADARLDAERRALGLSEGVKLLPASEADAVAAQVALNQQSGVKYHDSHTNKRQKIMTESIFGGAGGEVGAAAGGEKQQRHRQPSAAAAAAAAAAAGGGGGGGKLSGSSSRGHHLAMPPPPARQQQQQLAKPPRKSGLAALAGGAAAAGGSSSNGSRAAALQKQQLQQRVLLAKRRKQG